MSGVRGPGVPWVPIYSYIRFPGGGSTGGRGGDRWRRQKACEKLMITPSAELGVPCGREARVAADLALTPGTSEAASTLYSVCICSVILNVFHSRFFFVTFCWRCFVIFDFFKNWNKIGFSQWTQFLEVTVEIYDKNHPDL